MNRTEAIRAAIVLLVTNTLNMLVLTKLVQLEPEQVAGITAALNSLITLVFLFWKNTEPTTSDPPVGTVWTPPHG